MRKGVKITGLMLVGALIVAQFIQPEKNLHEGPQDNDLMNTLDVPELVADLLINSCYDCHSNNTRYPWYSKISPVSWYLHKHVEEAKEAVNFDEFGLLAQRKMIGTLSDICELIESGSMPLVSYRIIHRDANLDEEAMRTICDWTQAEAENLMRAGANPVGEKP